MGRRRERWLERLQDRYQPTGILATLEDPRLGVRVMLANCLVPPVLILLSITGQPPRIHRRTRHRLRLSPGRRRSSTGFRFEPAGRREMKGRGAVDVYHAVDGANAET